jgi:hypothetical protein
MEVEDHGKKIVVRDEADERLLFPQELTLLAELSKSLKVVGWYGNFASNQPLDHSAQSKRMIGVLQKVG